MEVKTSVQVGLGVCGSIRKEMEFLSLVKFKRHFFQTVHLWHFKVLKEDCF